MPLAVLALGWGAVTAWYLAWDAVVRRRRGEGTAAGGSRWLGPDWRVYMVEAVLLTLLAALWFGSLGHGGWVLLFLLIGAMTEWAARTRGTPHLLPGAIPGFLGGVTRTVVAGGLLRWIL